MGQWTSRLSSDSSIVSDSSSSSIDERKPKRRGFDNLGNTCYLGSVVMALASLRELTGPLQSSADWWQKTADVKKTEKLHLRIKFISELFECLQTVCATRCAPSASALHYLAGRLDSNFRNRRPQDAHEFLGLITEAMEVISDAQNKHESSGLKAKRLVHRFPMFFELENCVTCQQCGVKSKTKEGCNGLSVDMDAREDSDWSFWSSWLQGEQMTGANRFFCDKCNQKVEATRSSCPLSLPSILVVHYKLFRVDFTDGRLLFSKILSAPFPPLRIAISEIPMAAGRMATNDVYALKSVVVHQGRGLEDGHYICATRARPDFSKWRVYDDEKVFDVDLDRLKRSKSTSTPYLMFYEKVAKKHANRSANKVVVDFESGMPNV